MRRPKTRGDCEFIPRPCPFVGCKYNLYLDVNPVTGHVKINTDGAPSDMPSGLSCALDVADEGQHTQWEVARILGKKQAAVFYIEQCALKKMKNSLSEG